jgi:hypothetical protein
MHVRSSTNLSKSMWKLVFNVASLSFFDLEILKRKPTKSQRIMPRLKLSKNMLLGQGNWKKNKKIATHMNLWKYDQILTIQNSLIIKWLRFSKKRFFIRAYHFVLHCILNPNKNLECESM